MSPAEAELLIRQIDALESATPGYLDLQSVRDSGLSDRLIDQARAADILLTDHRNRVDPETRSFQATTVCRLNRRHRLVQVTLQGPSAG